MKIALEHKPKLIIGGFSAYSRIMDWSKFREIADAVGAYLLVDMAHVAGLVAAGVYPNPILTRMLLQQQPTKHYVAHVRV